MNLDQAIKKIINDHGADILKERRVVSMLSDLQAFGQLPYAANMLRHIYDNGYGTKIHQLYCSQDQTEVAAFLSELRNKLGFDENMLKKILYAFSLPVAKTSTKKKNTNQQKNTNQRNQTNTQQTNASQLHYNQQYNNYNQQSSNYQQPTYQQPTYQQPTYQQPTYQQQSYNIGNGVPSNQRVDSNWNQSSYNTNQPYNNPVSEPSQNTNNVDERRTWKIIAVIVAIGLNILAYFVSNKWLLLIIILTIATIFMSYTYNDTSPTKIKAFKIIASITVIGLNIPTFDVSGWWLILTEPLTFCTIAFSVEKSIFKYGLTQTWTLFDQSECISNRMRIWLTGTWILFGLLIAIFISILTLIARWIVLIEVIVYTITYLWTVIYLNR
ncbi:MAG: hypothetical protein IKP73_08375 [Bacteroidales bacterium]|nr:hypothetical protein [Bacteroidales bacterium]